LKKEFHSEKSKITINFKRHPIVDHKQILKDYEKHIAYKRNLKKPEVVNLVLETNNNKKFLKYKKHSSSKNSRENSVSQPQKVS